MLDLTFHSDQALPLLQKLIEQRTGIVYEDHQDYLLIDKIRPLIIERGFHTLLDFYYFLKHDPEAEEAWRQVESALAVNESYFWRESEPIRVAAKVLVPRLQRAYPDRQVRIWHAGAAGGQEPYSMAIALLEAGRYFQGEIEIIATDFNEAALRMAREARYRERFFRALPPDLKEKYFIKTAQEEYQLVDWVREKVRFDYLNLMDYQQSQQMKDVDIIFCRNVFIYFSDQAIRQTVKNFYQSLRSSGYLFVAAAESLLKVTTLFELEEIDGALVYVKES